MLEILITIAFAWLVWQVIKLTFKVAWGLTKVIAVLLLIVSVPVLFVCLLFIGGMVALIPLALIGLAFGLLKAVV